MQTKERTTNEQTKERAGMLVAPVLAADGLVHAYWATGRIWPATDPHALALAVLNIDISFRPMLVGPLGGLLFCASALVLARVQRLGLLGRRVPYALLQLATLAVAAGLLMRGVAGIAWALGLGSAPRTLFYKRRVGRPGQIAEFPLRASQVGATDGAAYRRQITFVNGLDGTRSLPTSDAHAVWRRGYHGAFSSVVTAGPGSLWSIRAKLGH